MSQDTPSPEKQWYFGACHCHAVEYKVHLPSLYTPGPQNTAAVCNCSICLKNGYILVYPRREELVFLKGEETLKGYSFASKTTLHRFCPECGSSILNDPRGMFPGGVDVLCLNTRMLRDVDPQKLEAVAKKVDGRNSFGTQYNEQTA